MVNIQGNVLNREEEENLKRLIDNCEWEEYTAADIGPCLDRKNAAIAQGFGDTLDDKLKRRKKRVAKWRKKWPKNADGNVYVPYEFDNFLERPGDDVRSSVSEAIEYIKNRSCVHFVEHKDEDNYIYIVDLRGDGCYSYMGMQGGQQKVQLQSSSPCAFLGTVIHELLHALGFMHEMLRRDRDRYINVYYENIKTDEYFQYDMHDHIDGAVYGEEYDIFSIMHYGNYGFTRNGQKTLTAKVNESLRLGQRLHMSTKDVQQLNKMYQCEQFITRV